MQDLNPQYLTMYKTSLIAWTCGCLRFATARFLCCKHLIREFRKKQQSDPTLRIIKKYPKQNNVIWNTTAPYLEIVADKNTTTRTQQQRTYIGPAIDNSRENIGEYDYSIEQNDYRVEVDEIDEQFSVVLDNMRKNKEQYQNAMEILMDYGEIAKSTKNNRVLDMLNGIDFGNKNDVVTSAEQVQRRQRRHTFNNTYGSNGYQVNMQPI